AAHDEVLLHGFEGIRDETGLVARIGDFEVRRQRRPQLADSLLDPADDLERVGAFLLTDFEHHSGRFVEPCERARFLDTVYNPADIAQPDRFALDIGDDDALEILRPFHAAERTERQLAR